MQAPRYPVRFLKGLNRYLYLSLRRVDNNLQLKAILLCACRFLADKSNFESSYYVLHVGQFLLLAHQFITHWKWNLCMSWQGNYKISSSYSKVHRQIAQSTLSVDEFYSESNNFCFALRVIVSFTSESYAHIYISLNLFWFFLIVSHKYR